MLCYNKKETKANMKPWEQQEKENVNDLWKVSAKTHSLLLYPEASMLVKEKWGAWVKLSVNDRSLWTRAKKNQQNINSFIMVRLQAQGVKKWRWRNYQSCIRSNFRKETLDLSCSIKFYYSHFTAQALRFNFWCHVSCSFTSDFTKRYEVE